MEVVRRVKEVFHSCDRSCGSGCCTDLAGTAQKDDSLPKLKPMVSRKHDLKSVKEEIESSQQ